MHPEAVRKRHYLARKRGLFYPANMMCATQSNLAHWLDSFDDPKEVIFYSYVKKTFIRIINQTNYANVAMAKGKGTKQPSGFMEGLQDDNWRQPSIDEWTKIIEADCLV